MDRLHKAVERMCDARGVDETKRDGLHRAVDKIVARKAKATDAEAKPQATIYGNKVEPREGARESAAKQAAKNRTHAIKMNAFRKTNGAKDLLSPVNIEM